MKSETNATTYKVLYHEWSKRYDEEYPSEFLKGKVGELEFLQTVRQCTKIVRTISETQKYITIAMVVNVSLFFVVLLAVLGVYAVVLSLEQTSSFFSQLSRIFPIIMGVSLGLLFLLCSLTCFISWIVFFVNKKNKREKLVSRLQSFLQSENESKYKNVGFAFSTDFSSQFEQESKNQLQAPYLEIVLKDLPQGNSIKDSIQDQESHKQQQQQQQQQIELEKQELDSKSDNIIVEIPQQQEQEQQHQQQSDQEKETQSPTNMEIENVEQV